MPSRSAKVRALRSGMSQRGILTDDSRTAHGRVVSLHHFKRLSASTRRKYDVKGMDTNGGRSLPHDRKAFGRYPNGRKKVVNRKRKAPAAARAQHGGRVYMQSYHKRRRLA